MANRTYTYSVSADFPSKKVDIAKLTTEIKKDLPKVEYGNVNVRFVNATKSGDTVSVTYTDRLSSKDEAKLDEIIHSHQYDLEAVTDDLGSFLNYMEEPPNYRMGVGITNRDKQIMTWRLPNGSSVQMYINPQNFVVAESKQISSTRTKGGFVVQYWGDNLARITLSGTTGSSGVKGVQVLRDVYRAENRAFELVAATQISQLTDLVSDGLGLDNAASVTSQFADQLRDSAFILRPSLASLALSMLLFYQGIQYRGFFMDFSVTESTQNLGLFDYNMTFMVTEIRGSRENFMAWHKEPLADSAGAQLASGVLNAVGNSIRRAVRLPEQAQNPTQFHPESAPLSFGGTELGTNAASTIVDML
jgi:hypothetical protein